MKSEAFGRLGMRRRVGQGILTGVVLGLQGERTLSVGSELLYHIVRFPPNATATVIASPKAMGCNGAQGLTTGFVSVKATDGS